MVSQVSVSSVERTVHSATCVSRLSLVLRKGKEDIERANSLIAGSTSSLASAGSTPSLYRRLAQTDSDTELVPNPVPESEIRAAMNETKANAEVLEEKAKVRTQQQILSPTRRQSALLLTLN